MQCLIDVKHCFHHSVLSSICLEPSIGYGGAPFVLGTRWDAAYVCEPGIKSPQALMRHELQVHIQVMRKPAPTRPIPRDPRPVHLPALASFECVARHLSFVRASEELDVTTTAISKTIKQLEAQLNVRLFNRTNPQCRAHRSRDEAARYARASIGSDSRFGAASGRFVRTPTWPAAYQRRLCPVRRLASGEPCLVRRALPGDHARYHDRQQSQ